MPQQQPVFNRLGLVAERVNAARHARSAERQKAFEPEAYDVDSQKSSLVHFSGWAAFTAYLEDDYRSCTKYAEETVGFAVELFFGDWRESVPNVKDGGIYPRERWLKLPWINQYRMAMLWGTSLGDWKAARRISEYPSERTIDEISERKSEAPWYQLLAACLRGESLAAGSEAVEKSKPKRSGKEGSFEQLIEQGRSKRLKLLTATLGAIQSGNGAEVQKSLDAYLAYYRKTEFVRQDVEDKLAVDGSILVHLAEHKGFAVKIAPEVADNIIRIPPEFLK